MIRAVLFDKDGTLTDFRATWELWMPGTVHDLAMASGAPAGDVAAGFGFDLERGRITPEGLFVTAPGHVVNDRVADIVGWSPAALARWMEPRTARVAQVAVPGVARLLARLRCGGLALGVLTNAQEAEAARHLRAMGATAYLDRVIGCNSGFGAKPDPRGAADFADRLGLRRDEVALVGDGLTDMAAAEGAGLVPVGVLTGTLDRATLAGRAAAVLPDVSHLPDWLALRGVSLPPV